MWEVFNDYYLNMIRDTDLSLQQLEDGLDELGLWEDTVVIFTADQRSKVGVVVNWTCPGEESEDFAGDGAFEQSQDLFLGAAFGPLALDVAASLCVVGHAYQGNSVQCAVGCAVTAARKSMAGGLARGRWNGGRLTQRSEGGLVAEPVRVGAGGDQQLGGDVGTRSRERYATRG
jgi:hypothetical protein